MLRTWRMKFWEAGLVWEKAGILYRKATERGGQRLLWPSEIEFAKVLESVWEWFLIWLG